jgi:hypothetical protein
MRIREALGFILLGRPVRRRPRGPERLRRDLASVERMTGPERGTATERLTAAVGPELLLELEQSLDLEGRLAQPARKRSRTRRAA